VDAEDLTDDTLVLSGFTSGAFFAERYRLEKLLGAGAMGKVFAATDTQSGATVAIKVLHPERARKEIVLERFRREAEILRGLGHGGIVRVLDAGRSAEGVDYLTMELLEGRTLKAATQADGPWSPEAFLPLLVQMCDALDAAHLQGVVHRDLKPDNVFLSATGEVKVVDFGLSRLHTTDRITKTGVMLGTPRYMAPEQIMSAKDATARTDVYACGVLTYEALTGASPFPAGDQGQLIGCVMEGRVVPLVDARPGLPPALGDAIARAMAKDPKDRFATMGAFAEAFAAAIGRSSGRSSLVLEAGVDLFADAEETDGRRHAIDDSFDLPRASSPVEPARFTAPPDAPTLQRVSRDPAPPKKRSGLFLALFAIALVLVACSAAGLALGARGCQRAIGQLSE